MQYLGGTAGLQSRLAADHDLFVRLQARVDQRDARAELSHFDRAILDRSVRLDRIDVTSLRTLQHGSGGKRQRLFPLVDFPPDNLQRPPPQVMFWGWEKDLYLHPAAGVYEL